MNNNPKKLFPRDYLEDEHFSNEGLNKGVICHLECYNKKEIDYADAHSIDLIVRRTLDTAAFVFNNTGSHTPAFAIFGTTHPLMGTECDCHGWILSGVLSTESEITFDELVDWTKKRAEDMNAFCIVSCAEICTDKKTSEEAINVQVEHCLGDRRVIAKFHRNQRNWSLLDWEHLDNYEPPIEQLKGILPMDPIFANAETV